MSYKPLFTRNTSTPPPLPPELPSLSSVDASIEGFDETLQKFQNGGDITNTRPKPKIRKDDSAENPISPELPKRKPAKPHSPRSRKPPPIPDDAKGVASFKSITSIDSSGSTLPLAPQEVGEVNDQGVVPQWVLPLLEEFQKTHVKDRKHRFRTHKNVFLGNEMVTHLVEASKTFCTEPIDRAQALLIGRAMFEGGYIKHALDKKGFEDKKLFYRFTSSFYQLTTPPADAKVYRERLNSYQSPNPPSLSQRKNIVSANSMDTPTRSRSRRVDVSPPPNRCPSNGQSTRNKSEAENLEAESVARLAASERKGNTVTVPLITPESPDGGRLSESSRSSYEWTGNKAEFGYESMIHQFPAVEAQTRAGLAVCLRFGKYMKKTTEVLKVAIAEQKKAYVYEIQKLDECKQDCMTEHHRAIRLQFSTDKEAQKKLDELKREFTSKIVEPILKFHDDKLKKMDDLARNQKAKSSALENLSNQLSDARKSCLKKYKELKSAHDKLQRYKKPSKDKTRYEAKMKKAQDAAQKQFSKTETLERKFADEQAAYRHAWLPDALCQMREIEKKRLVLQKLSMLHHGRLQLAFLETLTREYRKSYDFSNQLDAEKDIVGRCQSWAKEFGPAPPLAVHAPLPCSSEDLKSDRWIKVMEEKARVAASEGADIKENKSGLGVINKEGRVILNTPIDKTTTLEATGEEWARVLIEHQRKRPAETSIEIDDILHVLNKSPTDNQVIRVYRSLLKTDEKIVLASMDDQEKGSKSILKRFGISSDTKGHVTGKVKRVWQSEETWFCEISVTVGTAQSPRSPRGKGLNPPPPPPRASPRVFVQELMPEYHNELTMGSKVQALFPFKSSGATFGFDVKKGEELSVIRTVAENEDFVHVLKQDLKTHSLLPLAFVKPLGTKISSKVKIDPEEFKVALPNGVKENPPRGVVSQLMWHGLNLRTMERGLFPAHCVTSVAEKAKNVGDDDDDEEEGDDDNIGHERAKSVKMAGRNIFTDMMKSTVSKKKRRFVRDGFNLDLSYITPNIIAMGFPSTGTEAVYRNNMADVQRFFKEKHPKNFWIYNLCIEKGREYDPRKFDERVTRRGFHDHNPCPFEMIEPFCKEVKEFFNENPKGVAAIHCKAGKGRTGFLIACYLIYTNPWFTADRALRFFAVKRTKNQKGVTIPSQRRYVGYFDRMLRDRARESRDSLLETDKKSTDEGYRGVVDPWAGLPPVPKKRHVKLMRICLLPIPHVCRTDQVFFSVWSPTPENNDNKQNIWKSKGAVKCQRRPAQDYMLFTGGESGIKGLEGDAKFTFTYEQGFMSRSQKLFHFWINTRFLHPTPGKPGFFNYTLFKAELDKACKDKAHEVFSDAFCVEMEFLLDEASSVHE